MIRTWNLRAKMISSEICCCVQFIILQMKWLKSKKIQIFIVLEAIRLVFKMGTLQIWSKCLIFQRNDKNDETNFVFSPINIHSLVMTMLLSNGHDIQRFLGCPNETSCVEMSNFYSDVLESVEGISRSSVALTMANAIFFSDKVRNKVKNITKSPTR